MENDDEGREAEPLYDIRRNPRRGVRVKPLPKYVHDEFRQFCDGLRQHAQSHLSTVRLAKASAENQWVICQSVYWHNCLKYINTIEYLGTANARRK
jgi:hypothetical protein